jgi:hypothetical protein
MNSPTLHVVLATRLFLPVLEKFTLANDTLLRYNWVYVGLVSERWRRPVLSH